MYPLVAVATTGESNAPNHQGPAGRHRRRAGGSVHAADRRTRPRRNLGNASQRLASSPTRAVHADRHHPGLQRQGRPDRRAGDHRWPGRCPIHRYRRGGEHRGLPAQRDRLPAGHPGRSGRRGGQPGIHPGPNHLEPGHREAQFRQAAGQGVGRVGPGAARRFRLLLGRRRQPLYPVDQRSGVRHNRRQHPSAGADGRSRRHPG